MRSSQITKSWLLWMVILFLFMPLNNKAITANQSYKEPTTYTLRTDLRSSSKKVSKELKESDVFIDENLQILPLFIALVIAVGVTIYLMTKKIEQ